MRIKTKTGRLTAYGLACGYLERKSTSGESGSGKVAVLWSEGTRYHVRLNDWTREGCARVFWEVFDSLAEARDCFSRCPGRLLNRVRENV